MELQTRAGFRSQITKIVNEATEYLKSSNPRDIEDLFKLDLIEEELSSYLQRLTTANSNLNVVNKDIQAKLIEDKSPEKIAEYEDAAVGMIARLQIRLTKIKRRIDPTSDYENSQRLLPSTRSHCTKLPKLQLKRFSGDYQEWIPFWENFRSTVHENESLSGVEKFNFLQSVLTGNAAKTIVGFTPSDTCYDGAISLLQEEYGDTEKLIDKLMQKLMALPTVHNKTDAPGLRQLYNTVIACSRSLTALGVPSSHYYIMLKTILLKCMPNELRIDYHRIHKELADKGKETTDLSDDSSSTLSLDGDKQVKNILRFLKQEVESIERAAVGKTVRSQVKYTPPTTAAGLFTPARTSNAICFFCKSAEHSTRECDCARAMNEKKQMLKEDGRCFRCTQRGHTVKFCRVKGLVCKICKRMHATVLCGGDKASSKRNTKESASDTATLMSSTNLCASNNSCQFSTNIFLQTARVLLSSPTNDRDLFVRIIIDGGSQKTYVRETVANKLKLPIIGFVSISVIPFGNTEVPSFKRLKTAKLVIKSQFSSHAVEIVAVVVPEICLDTLPAPDNCSQQIHGFCLADSNVNGRQQMEGLSVLIGADYFWKIVTGKYQRLANGLTAVDTVFGWTLQGPYTSEDWSHSAIKNVSTLCSFSLFENMWNMELLGIRNDDSEMKTFTKELQTKCIRKTPTRYEALLPWKRLDHQLETNRENAISRLYSLTRRLSRDPKKLLEYEAVMHELISSGCAELVPHQTDASNLYYMPHCAVYRPEKSTTKIRIVFDASSHAPGKFSLNDCLWTGSNLLPDILKILLHFRFGKVGMVADIEKAFLQIALADNERDSHRFLWFADKVRPSAEFPPIQEFRMTRVTFGVTCSPFLLSATIDLHLQTTSDAFPNTCSRLRKSFYMDDLVTSVNNRAEAELFYQESTQIMSRAYMNLRKWVSNDEGVRRSLGIKNIDCMQTVLGVRWDILSDELTLNIKPEDLQKMISATKRNVLKVIARIYDPLGYLNPVVIRLKILFQSLWRNKFTWDQPIGDEFLKEWSTCVKDLDRIGELSFPRWLGVSEAFKNTEMHIFADASQKAFGAVAFLRIEDSESEVQVRFVCSKVRVAPLKQSNTDDISLPKLELAAALVAARLCAYFKKCHIPCEIYYLWTDSQITLHWIRGDVRRWKPFVFNRVKEIQDLTNKMDWRHCSGSENPADLITRGISVQQLAASMLWKDGPHWLKGDRTDWPSSTQLSDIEESTTLFAASEETVSSKSGKVLDPIFSYEKISSWKKLLRITCYIFRAIDIIFHKKSPVTRFLGAMELQKAEDYWLKFIQNTFFTNEILSLQVGKPIPRSSTLLKLNPFVDNAGFLRLGSRLQQLEESLDVIYPIILPKGCFMSKLIANYFHSLTLHGGVNTVLTRMRERYWLPGGRQLIKRVIADCRVCRRLKGKAASQPFAPLPLPRLMAARPFETVGVDFAGPLYTANNGERSKKVYIMIFTCAAVRAIHLELVLDLTTESCLLAIRRFIARRGSPNIIYSDNAKTFKKAATEVKSVGEIFDSEVFHGFLSNRGIIWRFSVERAPWWGGFWERMVKSVKDILKVTIWKAKIDIDELYTLLTEAERIINTRPLTYISDDPLDLSPLTPDNFLTGASSPIENESRDRITSSGLRAKWIARLKYTSLLWKRWKTEYLGLLRSAHQSNKCFSKEIRLGDVVLVYDTATPRIHWKLAIVENCFPGRDGKVRATEVRFADGKKLRRAIQLLYPLEICDRDLSRAEDVEN